MAPSRVEQAALAAARLPLRLLAPGGSGALSILIYHRVLPERDPLRPGEPDQAEFAEQMAWVQALFRVLPLSEAVAALRRGRLPPRAACITFDDGYADNLHCALPVLHALGLPATCFVAADYLDGGVMFNDRIIEVVRALPKGQTDLSAWGVGVWRIAGDEDRHRLAEAIIRTVKHLDGAEREEGVARLVRESGVSLPCDLMMTTGGVRRLAAGGFEIGAHTRTHPILSRVDDATARAEIGGSREVLEDVIGEPVRLFAYPNGRPGHDYTARDVQLVKACGFQAAVSTAWGAARRCADPWQLPRFTPWDRHARGFVARMFRNLCIRRPKTVTA
ncbi:polysaccharide deacetylase family protein [Halorhodospira sp. 9621]|uniref:polysaccharide deacetylase family protein n=1 Tax=Halorhodospira sp. 9621 TaxID=2899135 RepID=UPI001EE85D46|nr:polysaccharide deacetylase family protein [Halorhodospira sp. 9621]